MRFGESAKPSFSSRPFSRWQARPLTAPQCCSRADGRGSPCGEQRKSPALKVLRGLGDYLVGSARLRLGVATSPPTPAMILRRLACSFDGKPISSPTPSSRARRVCCSLESMIAGPAAADPARAGVDAISNAAPPASRSRTLHGRSASSARRPRRRWRGYRETSPARRPAA